MASARRVNRGQRGCNRYLPKRRTPCDTPLCWVRKQTRKPPMFAPGRRGREGLENAWKLADEAILVSGVVGRTRLLRTKALQFISGFHVLFRGKPFVAQELQNDMFEADFLGVPMFGGRKLLIAASSFGFLRAPIRLLAGECNLWREARQEAGVAIRGGHPGVAFGGFLL